MTKQTIMQVVLQVAIPHPTQETVDVITSTAYIELGADMTPTKVLGKMKAQVTDAVVKARAHKPVTKIEKPKSSIIMPGDA